MNNNDLTDMEEHFRRSLNIDGEPIIDTSQLGQSKIKSNLQAAANTLGIEGLEIPDNAMSVSKEHGFEINITQLARNMNVPFIGPLASVALRLDNTSKQQIEAMATTNVSMQVAGNIQVVADDQREYPQDYPGRFPMEIENKLDLNLHVQRPEGIKDNFQARTALNDWQPGLPDDVRMSFHFEDFQLDPSRINSDDLTVTTKLPYNPDAPMLGEKITEGWAENAEASGLFDFGIRPTGEIRRDVSLEGQSTHVVYVPSKYLAEAQDELQGRYSASINAAAGIHIKGKENGGEITPGIRIHQKSVDTGPLSNLVQNDPNIPDFIRKVASPTDNLRLSASFSSDNMAEAFDHLNSSQPPSANPEPITFNFNVNATEINKNRSFEFKHKTDPKTVQEIQALANLTTWDDEGHLNQSGQPDEKTLFRLEREGIEHPKLDEATLTDLQGHIRQDKLGSAKIATAELALKASDFQAGSAEAFRLQAALNVYTDRQLTLDGQVGSQTLQSAENFMAAHPEETAIASDRLDYQHQQKALDLRIAQNASADPQIVRQIQATTNLLYPNYPIEISGQADQQTFSRLELMGIETPQMDQGVLNDVQAKVLETGAEIAPMHVAELALQADSLSKGSGRAFELQAGLNLYTNREIAVDGWPGKQTEALAQTFKDKNQPLIEVVRNTPTSQDPSLSRSLHFDIPLPDHEFEKHIVEFN